METLRISLVQIALFWEDASANLQYLEDLIARELSQGKTDLIILPEMFTTGFSMNASALAEPMDGGSVQWMTRMAETYNCALAGSVIILDNDRYVNRFLLVDPGGVIDMYDKRHLFTLAGEHKVYQPGNERKVISYKGWRLCPQICYDLRFPVWSRNDLDYDLLLYVANWPVMRIAAWDALLKARAIENLCYVAGVNRTGTDGNGFEHSGHSAVYDALGGQLQYTEASGVILHQELRKDHLTEVRSRLRFLQDRDEFEVLNASKTSKAEG